MPDTGLYTLVTGGAGFIGSHIAHRLLALGHRVRIVDNLSTGFRENIDAIGASVDFIEGDLRDPAVCDAAARGVQLIFHVAALPSVPRSLRDPIGSHESNVTGTLNILEAARHAGVKRLVYSSSSSVYGDTSVLPKKEGAELLPKSPYAAAKLAGEQYVLAYARAGLVEGVALRYFNVFGPRQDPNGPYAAVIPLFMRSAMTGQRVPLYGDGTQTRDFTYIDNVVEANLLAGTLPSERVSGWVVNCGADHRASLLELVELIEKVTERRVVIEQRPTREGDVRDSQAGLDRARQVLGYEPHVSLEDGLRRTWTWMQSGERAAAPVLSDR
ncbi:MAG TPA: SDR family NAD(P)-dependent oxidoreductase [Gemmatimonadaceae bacterium]|nr:SDR family NAD(P)-dependent oxidoreductase [Gemmatimonadaceae bacterium]